jgi:hypothetical protein
MWKDYKIGTHMHFEPKKQISWSGVSKYPYQMDHTVNKVT